MDVERQERLKPCVPAKNGGAGIGPSPFLEPSRALPDDRFGAQRQTIF
jgi:hypothetical protein